MKTNRSVGASEMQLQFSRTWELRMELEGSDSSGGRSLSGMSAVNPAASAEVAGFGMVRAAQLGGQSVVIMVPIAGQMPATPQGNDYTSDKSILRQDSGFKKFAV